MARSCSICSRADAGAINTLLAEGRSARSVAVERGLSEDAVQRHAHRHVAAQRMSPRPAPRRSTTEAAADPLDELVDALRNQALAGNPAIVHQYRLALAAQADVRHAIPAARDLASEPEWIGLRTAMLAALEPFPEARQAVADALGAA
jgi:hypothetical protein